MAATSRIADMAWTDLAGGRFLLALPLGATEQHGPHLPLGTDTCLAVALAERLAAARPDTLVAPPLPFGSSGEHAGFPGTLSIGREVTEAVLVELVRSADAFAGVVVVSGHGGNVVPLNRAVARLRGEGRRVLAWAPRRPPGCRRWDLHAGWAETSMMLALGAPGARAGGPAGDPRPWEELSDELEEGGVAAVSPSGVLGDPAGATAGAGAELLDQLASELFAVVAAAWPVPL